MNPAIFSFSLNFDAENASACFPFIFEGKSVTSKGIPVEERTPVCIVSERSAGNMVFRGSHGPQRKDFFRSLGIPPEKVYSLIQVHSKDVYTLGSTTGISAGNPVGNCPDICSQRCFTESLPTPEDFAREGDGMVSFSPDAFLAITVADCLPVFLLDTENGFFAVLHSGWKGTGIVLKALEIMQNAGTRTEAVAAVLGPCIQNCCYRVDEERAKLFEAEFGSASPYIPGSCGYPLGNVLRHDNTGWYLDLQAANARLLTSAGVKHIARCTDCTFTDERLGSFRREGEKSYTRMIAMAGFIRLPAGYAPESACAP